MFESNTYAKMTLLMNDIGFIYADVLVMFELETWEVIMAATFMSCWSTQILVPNPGSATITAHQLTNSSWIMRHLVGEG